MSRTAPVQAAIEKIMLMNRKSPKGGPVFQKHLFQILMKELLFHGAGQRGVMPAVIIKDLFHADRFESGTDPLPIVKVFHQLQVRIIIPDLLVNQAGI